MRPRSSEPALPRRAALRLLALAPLLGAALRLLALAPLLGAAAAVAPRRAAAQSKLDPYRAQGFVAERFDGYVEVREGADAPADARALVQDVNAQRRELYRKRANETNVPVEEVGKLFATKIAEQAPAGVYFRRPDGSYARK